MRFLANGMLGKLARWLRMIGCDVQYFNDLDDDELVEIAVKERRILLTRDSELFRKTSVKGVEAFIISGRTEAEKLAELAQRFNIRLEIDIHHSRCPRCNAEISPVPKDKIRGKVPPSTFRFYDDFWICPACDQVYWRGSHWDKINRTLSEARQMV